MNLQEAIDALQNQTVVELRHANGGWPRLWGVRDGDRGTLDCAPMSNGTVYVNMIPPPIKVGPVHIAHLQVVGAQVAASAAPVAWPNLPPPSNPMLDGEAFARKHLAQWVTFGPQADHAVKGLRGFIIGWSPTGGCPVVALLDTSPCWSIAKNPHNFGYRLPDHLLPPGYTKGWLVCHDDLVLQPPTPNPCRDTLPAGATDLLPRPSKPAARVISPYPHVCRGCGAPAYVGLNDTDCSKKCGKVGR